jgi:hypothetical protein
MNLLSQSVPSKVFSPSFFQFSSHSTKPAFKSLLCLMLIALACVACNQAAAQTVSFTVTTLTDDATGVAGNCNQTQNGATPNGNCSLRDAFAAAAAETNSTINFAAALTNSPGIITLGSGGTLMSYVSLNIEGPGANLLTISGAKKHQPFVFVSGTVSISGLTITDGYGGDGGAIYNYTTLTVNDCTISSNSATDGGGGIDNQGGTLTVNNSTISGNSTPGAPGGGIDSTGPLTVNNSTISGNSAENGGGIRSCFSSLTVSNSVVSNNSATGNNGAGIENCGGGGSLTVTNSIFTGNSVTFGEGGAIYTVGVNSIVSNSIIGGNSAPQGEGDGIYIVPNSDPLTLTNDVISDSIQGSYTGSISTGPIPTSSLLISGTAISIVAGATTGNTSVITLTPSGGFTGSVALTAAITSSPSGASDLPTLSFGSTSPVNITGTYSGTATLTITTKSSASGTLSYPKRPGIPWYAFGGSTLAICLLFFNIPARRSSWRNMLGILALFVILAGGFLVNGCGSGSGNGSGSGSGSGGSGNSSTTPGTYTITVTGATASATETGTITLTVQ